MRILPRLEGPLEEASVNDSPLTPLQTPTSDTFRSAELPDADEIMGSAGFSYRFDDHFSMTLSYSYGSYADAPVNLSLFGSGTLAGTFRRSSNAFALQTRWEL